MATEVEARLLLNSRFRKAKSWEAAGRRWFVGRVGAAAADAEPAADLGAACRTAPGGCGQRVVVVISGYDKANAAAATTLLIERFSPVLVINFGIAGAFPGSGLAPGDLVLATADSYGDTGASSPEGWRPAEEFGLPLAEAGGKRFWNTFPLGAALVRGAAAALRRAGWEDAEADRAIDDGPVEATEGSTAGAPVAGDAAFPRGDAAAPRGAARGRRLKRGPCVTLSQVTGTAEEARALEARWGALAESMEGAACAHICALYGIPFLEVRGISNLVGDRDRRRWDVTGAAAEAVDAVSTVLCAQIPGLLGGRE